jgi:hypothetical protein
VFFCSRIARAAASFSGLTAAGRPRALAASRPASERSRVSSRSLCRACGYAERRLRGAVFRCSDWVEGAILSA